MPAADRLPLLVPLDLPAEDDPLRQMLDARVPGMMHGDLFSFQPFGAGPMQDRGWKLHVSATPLSAELVLERALPLLLAEAVRFKAVGTRAGLLAMNAGRGGRPQIGKFITVYPSDDAQAVRLARALDAATDGLRGPRVPSDRPLRPGSLVHYRYGDFRAVEAEPEGVAPAVNGGSAPGPLHDQRKLFYVAPPDGVRDPFEGAGAYAPAPERSGVFAQRYLVLGVLGGSYRGGVYRALDLRAEPPRPCVLKEYWHAVGTDVYGREARAWGENEAAVLTRIAGESEFPRLCDGFELDGNFYLALEFIEGRALEDELRETAPAEAGQPARLVTVARDAAGALMALHDRGFVHADLKPANLIRTPAGGYRLIDFGVAYDQQDPTVPALSHGTPPFASPQQIRGEAPEPRDDIFGWGAVLRCVAANAPAALPSADGAAPMALPELPPIEAGPTNSPALASVLERATARDRSDRYASMREALAAFEQAAAPILAM